MTSEPRALETRFGSVLLLDGILQKFSSELPGKRAKQQGRNIDCYEVKVEMTWGYSFHTLLADQLPEAIGVTSLECASRCYREACNCWDNIPHTILYTVFNAIVLLAHLIELFFYFIELSNYPIIISMCSPKD